MIREPFLAPPFESDNLELLLRLTQFLGKPEARQCGNASVALGRLPLDAL